MQVGEEFCGSKSEVLQESIKRQSVNYFKNYHRWDKQHAAPADFTRYLFTLRILSYEDFYLGLSTQLFVPSSHDDIYIALSFVPLNPCQTTQVEIYLKRLWMWI